jgi:hypothetical protein
MPAPPTVSLLLLSVLSTVAGACSSRPPLGDGVFELRAGAGERPRLRYPDGQSSPNDSCMIRLENGLNPKVPPIYVNGRPMGFC